MQGNEGLSHFEGKSGVFGYSAIKELVERGFIKHVPLENIQPGSLDIRVSDEIYELSAVAIPCCESNVLAFFKDKGLIKATHDISKPLLPKHNYLVRLKEVLNLPKNISALFSPKSSIGRLDMHVRVLNHFQGRVDALGAGYTGELWAIISPRSFAIKLYDGAPVTQIRFFVGDPRIRDRRTLESFLVQNKCVFTPEANNIEPGELLKPDLDNSLVFTINLEGEVIGWKAIKNDTPIDLSAKNGSYNALDFFEPLTRDFVKNGGLYLEKDRFYILGTYEYIKVPAEWSLEFLPIDAYSGEFRGHYAGFVDPGWGLSEPCGRPITLEVRPFEDMFITHRQPIVKAVWDRLLGKAEVPYDFKKSSNYVSQASAKLSKYFSAS